MPEYFLSFHKPKLFIDPFRHACSIGMERFPSSDTQPFADPHQHTAYGTNVPIHPTPMAIIQKPHVHKTGQYSVKRKYSATSVRCLLMEAEIRGEHC